MCQKVWGLEKDSPRIYLSHLAQLSFHFKEKYWFGGWIDSFKSRKFDWLVGVWEGWHGLGIAGRLRGGGQLERRICSATLYKHISNLGSSFIIRFLIQVFQSLFFAVSQLVARLDEMLIFWQSADIFLISFLYLFLISFFFFLYSYMRRFVMV